MQRSTAATRPAGPSAPTSRGTARRVARGLASRSRTGLRGVGREGVAGLTRIGGRTRNRDRAGYDGRPGGPHLLADDGAVQALTAEPVLLLGHSAHIHLCDFSRTGWI